MEEYSPLNISYTDMVEPVPVPKRPSNKMPIPWNGYRKTLLSFQGYSTSRISAS